MLRALLFLLLVAPLPVSSSNAVDRFFSALKGTSIHIFTPGFNEKSPMDGKPILPGFAKALGLDVGSPPYDSIEFYGVAIIQQGRGIVAYIVREPGMYESSVLALYYFNSKTHRLEKQLDLADHWGDDGYTYEKDSWFIDVDGDGYLDIVSKELKHSIDLERMDDPPVIQRKVSVLLYRPSGYISDSSNSFNATSLALKHDEDLWQDHEHCK